MSLCDCIKWASVCRWFVEVGVYMLDWHSLKFQKLPEICPFHLVLLERKKSSHVRSHRNPLLLAGLCSEPSIVYSGD